MDVRQITTEETYPLRSRVLRPGLPVESCRYPADPRAMHFGVFGAGRLVSVVTAHPERSELFVEPEQWRIRGMATVPEAQGRGYGGAALRAVLDWGQARGVPLFWCNARERAIPFYERHGFRATGGLFEIPGIGPHRVMWIRL